MPFSNSRRSLLGLPLLAAVACHSPSPPELAVEVPAALSAADFPGAGGLVRGFDAPSNDGSWRVGDEVLYGLRLRRLDRARHWLLHLRVTEPIALAAAPGDEVVVAGAPLPPLEWSIRINGEPQTFRSTRCRVEVTVTDAMGRVLGRSQPQIPRDFLAEGFAGACELVQRRMATHPETMRSEAFYLGMDVGPLVQATVCTIALLQVIQSDSVLAPLLWEVVQRPSWWSVVRHLGARVVLRPRFHAAAEVPSPVPELGRGSVWRVPVSLLVNESPALHVELLVGSPRSPLGLCGGVLGALARHPSDGCVEFALVLLGARRGPPVPSRAETAQKER